jgi:hypothetical protein
MAMAIGGFAVARTSGAGQMPAARGGGVLSGKVTGNNVPVHAVRVKARDTVRKITYTVFTNKGSYQIFNLPTGSYEVSALKEGMESTTQTVQMKAGETKTADLAVSAKPVPQKVELVDYDSLYLPGKGRDVFMKECGGCHGLLQMKRAGAPA